MAIHHYENFPVASVLLPPRFRRPVALIYAFARQADDFADEGEVPDAERLARLARFGEELDRVEQGRNPQTPLFRSLAVVIARHALPVAAFRDLLSAFAQDVTKKRYGNFAEVLDYCACSANPVGRLLLTLYGAATPENLAYSNAVCSSLQIINFLQDIALDYRKGRIYMPQDEMVRFAVTENQIRTADTGGSWWPFMKFQIERARELLWSGSPLGRILAGRIGLEMRMIIHGGDRVLTKLAKVGGDIHRHRPVLRWFDWPLMFLRAV